MIIKKDSEITNANKAKFDIQSELSTMTKKQKKDKTDIKLDQVVNTFFNKEQINFNQFDSIREENNAVKQEYKEYQRKFAEEHELREQQQKDLINKNNEKVTVIMMENAKCTGDLKP